MQSRNLEKARKILLKRAQIAAQREAIKRARVKVTTFTAELKQLRKSK